MCVSSAIILALILCGAIQGIHAHAHHSSSMLFYQSLPVLLLSGSGKLFVTVNAWNPFSKVIGIQSKSYSESTSSSYVESEETTEETEETDQCSCPAKQNTQVPNSTGKQSKPSSSSKDPKYPNPETSVPPPSVCTRSRYRTFDGSCNNLHNPSWGTPETSYGRLTPYNYANGKCSMPRSINGEELPNARKVSYVIFQDKQKMDDEWTLASQQWGQTVAHDMSHTSGVSQCRKEPATCCFANGQLAPDADTNPVCAPIKIPPNDPIHNTSKIQCFNFMRTGTTCSTCSYERPAEPKSTVTSYMDLSLVYGNNATLAKSLRSGCGGRLKTIPRNGQEWPPQVANASMICDLHSPDEPCYETGDIRMNQSPHLAVLHIIMLREHNRLADGLAQQNPHWGDEKLYQEARRIHIAENQHINYYEYFTIFLGTKNMVKNKLIYLNVTGYINDYDPCVNVAVLGEYASAAYRYFHTLIVGSLQLLTEDRTLVDTLRLSDWMNRPKPLENHFNDLTRGLATQKMGASDQYWDCEITQCLFRGNNTYGEDLRATDIQRGRDHGLPTYVNMRKICNLTVPKTFCDLKEYMSEENVAALKNLYYSIEDVDLVVAGSLEYNVKGALVGPTYMCIIIEQYRRTRVGDRYFYEMGDDPDIRFTLDQLQSIRKASMAKMICDNTDGIHQMQPKAFELISEKNKLVPCNELPSIDLSLWKEKC